MPWLIFVLGIGLAAGGGLSIVHGYPYVQIEFGWTQVIAGSMGLAGGIITIALGAVLLSLSRLRQAIERGSGGMAAPQSVPSIESSVAEQEPRAIPAAMPASVEAGQHRPASAPSATETAKPRRPRSWRPAEPVSGEALPQPHEFATAAASSLDQQPGTTTVLGRYQSSGSSYSLFNDGTIEVESEAGKRRFGSMGELKTFLANEKAPVLAEEIKS